MESYDKNRTHNLLIALTHQISFSTIHFIHFVLLLCPMLLSHAPLAFTPPPFHFHLRRALPVHVTFTCTKISSLWFVNAPFYVKKFVSDQFRTLRLDSLVEK